MNTTRHILHVDMDAFFASVEQRDFPELRGKPVLVGGASQQRGVVAACSYEARKFGVRSAMPMSQALRLCPQGILQPVRMARYSEVSKQIHQIFSNYTPKVEPLSIDEAFLDVTGSVDLLGDAETIGRQIKNEIREQTQLTASVGIASNKFLAKLASDLKKPDGFVVITDQEKQAVLDPLAVSRIWGIGKVTCQALEKSGIHTIHQLRTAEKSLLAMLLKNQAEGLLRLAQGIDEREVVVGHEARSISAEETFVDNIGDWDLLLEKLQAKVEKVSQQLRAQQLQARTITLKLRYGDFKTISRSLTLSQASHTTQTLWQEAKTLFLQWQKTSGQPLRLLGFGASNLIAQGDEPPLLFADPEVQKQQKLDVALDAIRNKFGDQSLRRGN